MKRPLCLSLITICVIYLLSGCNFYTNEYESTEFLFDTVCTIKADGDNSRAAVQMAFNRAGEIHRKTDFYSEESAVSLINNAAANEPVLLDDDMYAIISAALEVSEMSNGAFDITVAPLTELWAITSENPRVPDETEIKAELKKVDYRKLKLDKENKTLIKLSDEIQIDLGGAAKGYAADAAAQILSENGAGYGVVDFGGNICVTGKNPRFSDGKFKIGIQNPESKTGETSNTVEITSGSVVTCGTYQRYFEKDGVRYHHVLDPKTGRPSNSGVTSATVIYKSGLYADCISTACLVLGEESGKQFAEEFGAEVIYQ